LEVVTTNAREITLMTTAKFWSQHREASFNWLAFGLLLAAWNASDNDAAHSAAAVRPAALRGYAAISVRAAAHHRAVIKMST
jgi:hypothetical protein